MLGNFESKLGAHGTELWALREGRWGKKKHTQKNTFLKMTYPNHRMVLTRALFRGPPERGRTPIRMLPVSSKQ